MENELEIILKFVYKIPQLKQDILERIIQLLYGYIKEQIYYFNQQLIKLIPISIVDNKPDSTIDSITSDELILLFQFYNHCLLLLLLLVMMILSILKLIICCCYFWESMTNKYQMSLPSYYVGE